MAKFKLPRLKQCEGCPWKKSVDIRTIPNGYDAQTHIKLLQAKKKVENNYFGLLAPQQVMACHHSNDNDDMYCIGYLHNQLGVGNNITLRLRMMNCENISQIKIEGEQHGRFEDLIPEEV